YTVSIFEFTHIVSSIIIIDKTLDINCDLLGFEVLPRPNFGFPGLLLRVGSLQLHLGVVHEAPSAGPGFPHFALYVPTDEFDATIESVRAAGVKMLGEPSSRVDFETPVRAAFSTDPSGNAIELTDVGHLSRA